MKGVYMLSAQELRAEYEILNGQFTLLKQYGDLKQESPDKEWAALIDAACRIGDGYDDTSAAEYARAVTVATLNYIDRRSRGKSE